MSLFSENTQPSVPTQHITDTLLQTADIHLHIRREDELHPQVSGNKYRKLKYNLLAAKQQGFSTLLTFGGAYSNHIVATACAAQQMGFRCIGVIRGEELAEKWRENPTLALAHQQGMRLHFVSRMAYRQKHEQAFIHQLQQQFGEFYLIPEGGTNELAVQGCAEILTPADMMHYDVVCCAVGTGGTLAGLIQAVQHVQKNPLNIMGFAVLHARSLEQDIAQLAPTGAKNWQLNFDYTCGGYAKTTAALMQFITDFTAQHGIPLEPIYTGKMLYGVYDLIQQGYFAQGTRILAIHTGGLQGRVLQKNR